MAMLGQTLASTLLRGVKRTRRQEKRASSQPATRRRPSWRVVRCVLPDWQDFTVEAYSKSEARAVLKRVFGVRRVPAGTLIKEVQEADGES